MHATYYEIPPIAHNSFKYQISFFLFLFLFFYVETHAKSNFFFLTTYF